MKNIVCLYFSRTGHTKSYAEKFSEQSGADIFPFSDGKLRKGGTGYIGACFESFRKPKINNKIICDADLSKYDAAVLAFPIWVESPSIIGRDFLKTFAGRLPDEIYFIIPHQAKIDYEKQIMKLDYLLKVPHKSHLSLCIYDDNSKALEDFAESVKSR